MVTKRTEQEWYELIHDFENYGYKNQLVLCVIRKVITYNKLKWAPA